MAFSKTAKRFIIYLLSLTATGFIFYFSYSYFMTIAYPLKYKKVITKTANENKVDKYLLMAIIREESRFKEKSVSNKGAIGLMQLMPKTAGWVNQKRNRPLTDNKKLFDPQTNIEIGSWYYGYLKQKYKNDQLALAAYNSGVGVVDSWLVKNPQGDINKFHYLETRNFVTRVKKSQKVYQKLYSNL